MRPATSCVRQSSSCSQASPAMCPSRRQQKESDSAVSIATAVPLAPLPRPADQLPGFSAFAAPRRPARCRSAAVRCARPLRPSSSSSRSSSAPDRPLTPGRSPSTPHSRSSNRCRCRAAARNADRRPARCPLRRSTTRGMPAGRSALRGPDGRSSIRPSAQALKPPRTSTNAFNRLAHVICAQCAQCKRDARRPARCVTSNRCGCYGNFSPSPIAPIE